MTHCELIDKLISETVIKTADEMLNRNRRFDRCDYWGVAAAENKINFYKGQIEILERLNRILKGEEEIP